MNPDPDRNILVTNIDGTGENVLVYTSLDANTLAIALVHSPTLAVSFDDCVEIPDDDVQYHLFEPSWLTVEEENRCRKIAEEIINRELELLCQ